MTYGILVMMPHLRVLVFDAAFGFTIIIICFPSLFYYVGLPLWSYIKVNICLVCVCVLPEMLKLFGEKFNSHLNWKIKLFILQEMVHRRFGAKGGMEE